MQLIRPSSANSNLPRVDAKAEVRKRSIQQVLDNGEGQLRKNQILESLNLYEKQLLSIKGTAQYQGQAETIFKQLNNYAMKFYEKHGSPDSCILILQWIIQHRSFQEIPSQICLAYNNLGCVYRRQGQTQLAFNSFENALQLVQMYEQMKMETITFLNITTVLSQMNMHDKAVKAATKAIESGKKEFEPNSVETIRRLALAHFNLGFELESLDKLDEAVKQYKRALQFVLEHLGNKDPLFQRFGNQHAMAKQKLIASLSTQQPGLMKNVLQLKKQYEVPTDESQVQMTPQQTQKNFHIRNQNYMEDQISKDSVVTLKREDSVTIKKGMTDEENQEIRQADSRKESQVTQKKKQKVEEIQFQDWSNSEPSDQEVKKQRVNEQSQQMKGQPTKLGNKEQRLNFLSKQNAYKLVDDNLMEKEMQIIREIEGQIYNVKNISLIQANIRMRQEKKKFIKMKQAKKDQGELLPSDELKLKKFQRFIRRKLAQLKMRELTKRAVRKFKLKKNPSKENAAKQKVIGLLQAYKCHKQLLFVRDIRKSQQFHTLRSAYCKPTIIEDDKIINNKESYVFTFSITSDDSFVRFAVVHGTKELRKETRYGFEMDQQSFLKALGLMHQCIEELECYIIEEDQTLRNLKKLQTMSSQFLNVYESEQKYRIKNLTDSQKQYRVNLQRIGVIMQDLLYLNNWKLYIKGLNDFEYDDNVPIYVEQIQIKPPLYAKQLDDREINSIKIIQSFMRGFLQRIKVQKLIGTNTKKQLINSQLIKTNAGDYLQLVRALNQRNQKSYLYIINQATQKKSNDLEYQEVVFTNMGQLCKENMFDILIIDVNAPSIDYTDEADYWIQKQIEFQKRGGKRVISTKTKEEQICMIQRSILSYLLKRRCEMSKITRHKLSNSNNNKNITREMLVRRVLIYGSDMNSRACLTTLYLDVEKVDQAETEQTEYQSVLITSKNLEHVYSFDKVIPYYQKLFCPLPRTELITVAQKMVEESRIAKTKKGEQKVECRNVDEIHGELLSLFDEEEDATQKKENTLEPRQKINEAWRKKYLKQQIQNINDIPEKHNIQTDQHHLVNIQRKLHTRYKNHQMEIAKKVFNTKHVDVEEYQSDNNWDSVRNYVNNVLPTTEYGTDPTLFIEDEIEINDDQEQYQHHDLILDQNVSVNENSFRILIYYAPEIQTFSVTAEDLHTHQIYETSIEKKHISEDIPYIYIKENAAQVLLFLLEFYDNQIEFSLNELKLDKIKKDYEESKFTDPLVQQEFIGADDQNEQTTEKVTIGIYQKGNCTLTFEFHRMQSMIRIIILFNSNNESRVIEIDSHQFQSKYVDDKLKDMNNSKIVSFFKEFSKVITKIMWINEKELSHNFEDLRNDLPLYLREKFVQKIQGMLLVKRMVEKLRMYKLLKYSKLFMHKFIINNGQHYIEVIYFLIKKSYNLQVIFREITFVTPQGQLVEKSKTLKSKRRLREKSFQISLKDVKNDSKNLIATMTKRQDQMDLQRVDFNQLTDYSQMKTIEFYRNLMTPLVNIIQKSWNVNFNKFQIQLMIPIEIKEIKLRLKKQKTLKSSKFSYTSLLYAVEKLQSIYKRRFHESWYQQKIERKRTVENKNKHHGVFVNRTFKQIRDGDKKYYYIVNIYQKEGKIKGQIKFTFELIPVYRHERKQRLRTVYSWDPSELVHLGSDKLFNFFLNKIYIENQIIKFDDREYIPFQEEEQPLIDGFTSQQQISINKQFNIVEKDVQEILIDQEQVGQSVINVVYTDLKPLIEKKQVDPQAQNTITLQVNLQDIKKLYPNRDIKDKNTMKILSQNLIKGVKMDPNGNVFMDKGRIQSSFLNTVNRSTILQSRIGDNDKKPRLKDRPINFQVLAKDTVYYAGEKYLIVIKLIRNRIQKILNEDRDSVFEDHERIIEIKAQNLNQKQQQPIIWCITPDDAEILTHEQHIEEIAKVLTKHLQVLNGKFIYLCFNEKDQLKIKLNQEDNVILFVENIMQPIQRKFRNRKYHKYYKMYKDIRKKVNDENQFYLLQVSNLNTKNSVFIVLIVEDNKKKVTLMAWEASDAFYFYEIEVPVKKYLSTYQEDKTKCLKAMLNFFEFKQDINKLYFQHPKPEQVSDYFEQEKKLSMHSSSRLGSPDKSEQQSQSQKFIYDKQHDQTPDASPMEVVENLDQVDEIDEIGSMQFVKN